MRLIIVRLVYVNIRETNLHSEVFTLRVALLIEEVKIFLERTGTQYSHFNKYGIDNPGGSLPPRAKILKEITYKYVN
jgi:hypothetical protein